LLKIMAQGKSFLRARFSKTFILRTDKNEFHDVPGGRKGTGHGLIYPEYKFEKGKIRAI